MKFESDQVRLHAAAASPPTQIVLSRGKKDSLRAQRRAATKCGPPPITLSLEFTNARAAPHLAPHILSALKHRFIQNLARKRQRTKRQRRLHKALTRRQSHPIDWHCTQRTWGDSGAVKILHCLAAQKLTAHLGMGSLFLFEHRDRTS